MPRSKIVFCFSWLVVGIFLLSPVLHVLGIPETTALAQATQDASSEAQELLAQMTPEEKVGQLFLVTYEGTEIGPESPIFDLVTNYNVGGVVLLAEKGNIPANDPLEGTTVHQVYNIIRQLQINRWAASQTSQTNVVEGQSSLPTYIPLFVGIAQEGDGFSFDQILTGLTPLPNAMALGATWDTIYAQQSGEILGRELSALGINLLLGPSLDVLETQFIPGANQLGTRTFGGDPYWVSKMGQGFIQGVHNGSQNSVAVIAKHFPGLGSADRPAGEEISTIRKTLEQLKSFELRPFFSVTGDAPSLEATADGLLASHIRYQGFQGNIRFTTRPITFDQQAFNLVLELPQMASWQDAGGIIISDDLGSPALREFYETTSQRYDISRRVALDAFLAGNDILYVTDFTSGIQNSYESAKQTVSFFAKKYQEDIAFADRVDEAVLKILTLKNRLYSDFYLYEVLPVQRGLNTLNQPGTLTFDVARKAATLISPSQIELETTLNQPPGENDRIVFISDTRPGKQCPTCAEFPLIGREAMQDIILRRYGPQGTGQINPENLMSYSLADLDELVNPPEAGAKNNPDSQKLEDDLLLASWVVFNMLDASSSVPSFQTLSQFLAERIDLIKDKRVIVFAFNAPYFLDATEISKLTAFYSLYSKMPPFINTAAYLLFLENIQPTGASPVSIPGINYDINEALFPDPNQVIPLHLSLDSPTGTNNAITGQVPEVEIGDSIQVVTGEIYDHNGHAVPDGTPVEFLLSVGGEANPILQIATTTNGIAGVTFTIPSGGTLVIRATSEPAQSELVVLNVPQPAEGTSSPIEAEGTATQAVAATSTPILPPPLSEGTPPPAMPGFGGWVWATLLVGLVSWGAYRFFLSRQEMRWGARAALLALVGGLSAYTYVILGLSGSSAILQTAPLRAVIIVSVGGALFGILVALVWRQISISQKAHKNS